MGHYHILLCCCMPPGTIHLPHFHTLGDMAKIQNLFYHIKIVISYETQELWCAYAVSDKKAIIKWNNSTKALNFTAGHSIHKLSVLCANKLCSQWHHLSHYWTKSDRQGLFIHTCQVFMTWIFVVKCNGIVCKIDFLILCIYICCEWRTIF